MTAVYFKGRLGNQMFQYVFYRYLKEKNSDKLIFFSNPHHAYLSKYFELENYQAVTFESKIYSVLVRFIPRLLRFKDVYVQNFVRPRNYEARNSVVYNGYFQTDWYYNQLQNKPHFKIKPKYTSKFQTLYSEIFRKEKTIAVHIRRTDYLKYGKRDISLPIEYFKRRLSEIDDLDSYRVFFVSDDVPFVKSVFSEKSNFIFSDNDEITDFQILQNADIAIISNSSFGWWAAFLGKEAKIVYAPKNWMGFGIGAEHPKGVMTKKFIWEDVPFNNQSV
ncbi:alpha-1,2-fucosyltransferase [Paradesertivirga mongoliensis]|uniref:Alpha-1,2-fucosyltransferase n=1 Tax=Paradesertivirga mongoliensis TaxID=2100740 RepID=A0ABW4ZMQ7_9SPHI|nr:alpha-1,2-fucosyltransferase [Pedobacter mongoliensis]